MATKITHRAEPQVDMFEDEETVYSDPDGTNEDSDGLSIQIVDDDVPEEDRGKSTDPVAEPVSEDISEEELANYSEGVQKRIKQLRYEFHTERRARETAERQNSEAIRYAQTVAQENSRLKQTVDKANTTLGEALEKQLTADMELARKEYREASEIADTEAMLAAQEKIANLIAEAKTRPAPPEASEVSQTAQASEASQTQQIVTQREQDWFVKNNDWFNKDPEMTSFAYGVHEKLIRDGMHPRTDADRYFEALDSRIKAVFPDYFSSKESGQTTEVEVGTPEKKKPANVVAPVTRTGSASRKVQLTRTQVSLAKRLGLTAEQYAQQVLKERMAANG